MNKYIIKNIPNAITMSRIISSVVGAISFIIGNYPLSIITYIYGSISDALDGFCARKLDAYSEFGRKLDAISDKIFALSLLVPSIVRGNLLMILPLIYEAKIAITNYEASKSGKRVETIRIGKFKTALLFPTIIVGLLSTIKVEFYFLLMSMLPMTTLMQVKTYNAYNNINNENKDAVNKSNEIVENDEIDKELDIKKTSKNTSIKDLSNEFNYYLSTPIVYNSNTNNKHKVRVRELKKKL